MPSAFFDKHRNGWLADFRGVFQRGNQRTRVRMPDARIITPATAKADTKAFADELHRYCRLLEREHTDQDVEHARHIGAISDIDAQALMSGQPLTPRRKLEPLTIKDAALSHPSSQRDSLSVKLRYTVHLDQFAAFAGIKHQHLVTLDHVLRWIADLRAKGWAWDTRRHALLYLRRACVMGTGGGIPNVIIGHKLDHQERRQRIVRAWSLPQLAAALVAAEDEPRIRAAIALGSCLGLRPTEICRVTVDDLEGDVLHVGRRTAKNNASVRALPVPASILPWLKAAAGKRRSGPLIESDVRRRGRPLTPSGLHQALSDALSAKPRPPIAPKDLRKTFATWSSPIISGADLERFLGHASALHAQVTVRHYLAHHLAEQLRPAAQALDAALSQALRAAAVKPRRRRAV